MHIFSFVYSSDIEKLLINVTSNGVIQFNYYSITHSLPQLTTKAHTLSICLRKNPTHHAQYHQWQNKLENIRERRLLIDPTNQIEHQPDQRTRHIRSCPPLCQRRSQPQNIEDFREIHKYLIRVHDVHTKYTRTVSHAILRTEAVQARWTRLRRRAHTLLQLQAIHLQMLFDIFRADAVLLRQVEHGQTHLLPRSLLRIG